MAFSAVCASDSYARLYYRLLNQIVISHFLKIGLRRRESVNGRHTSTARQYVYWYQYSTVDDYLVVYVVVIGRDINIGYTSAFNFPSSPLRKVAGTRSAGEACARALIRGLEVSRLIDSKNVCAWRGALFSRRDEWSGRETLTHPKSIPQDIEKNKN